VDGSPSASDATPSALSAEALSAVLPWIAVMRESSSAAARAVAASPAAAAISAWG
jgi:hypothetical protein